MSHLPEGLPEPDEYEEEASIYLLPHERAKLQREYNELTRKLMDSIAIRAEKDS